VESAGLGTYLTGIRDVWPVLLGGFAIAYLVGSIPFAYIIVRSVTGEDITAHGTGNVGAMNVRRSTGSWFWFAVAMIADMAKGFVPVLLAELWVGSLGPANASLGSSQTATDTVAALLPAFVVAGCVFGHNYSIWMALINKRFARTGKGLATGAGALLAYDWRYFVAVVTVGLLVIAVTRYMMAGQVAAAITLPIVAIALGSPDWPFALLMGVFVYAAHHKRFMGLLRGEEPRLYVDDRMGPKG
jgi:glycerol-3-phosphate acyltransferase PlsY